MAVISVNRIGEQRIREVNNNQDGTVDLVFRVRTDTPTDGQAIVLASTGIASQAGTLSVPKPWDIYDKPYVSTAEATAMQAVLANVPYQTAAGPAMPSTCRCIRRAARQTDNNQTWEVTCTFSASNPLSIPWKITFHDESVKLASDSDVTGRPVRNSYGDPFATAFEIDRPQIRMHVVWNVATYDPLADARFLSAPLPNVDGRVGGGSGALGGMKNPAGPINDKEWWSFPALTVRYKPSNTEFMNGLEDVFPYFRREADFLVDATGWSYEPLDCGFRGINTNGRIGKFRNPDGTGRVQPTLLDGNGRELAQDAQGRYIAPAVYLKFDIYPPRDFSTIGLGTDRPW